MEIRKAILETFNDLLDEQGYDQVLEVKDDMILLDTDLDSLGFAMLIAKLEENLDYDPFVLMDEPYYPQTFGELFSIYEKYKDRAGK